MANRCHANCLTIVGQLVEDSIGADSQRVQTAQPAPEHISAVRFALEQSKRSLDRVDQWPTEFKQLPTSLTSENKPGQRSIGSRPAFGQLGAKLGESDGFVALDLSQASLQR